MFIAVVSVLTGDRKTQRLWQGDAQRHLDRPPVAIDNRRCADRFRSNPHLLAFNLYHHKVEFGHPALNVGLLHGAADISTSQLSSGTAHDIADVAGCLVLLTELEVVLV